MATTKVSFVDVEDLPDIAAGAAILGTGGGGDPHIGRLLAAAALRRHGPVRLVGLDDLPSDAVVLPVSLMGAPTVMVEKPPSVDQVALVVDTLAGYLGRAVTHIACAEAGGVNSLIPFVAAARLDVPLVDADMMGRAFPELQMVLPSLYGVPTTPMVIADEKGNRAVLDTVDNHWAERLARSATIDMGCTAVIATCPMTGQQAGESLVPGTLTLCRELGRLLRTSKAEHRDPVDGVVTRLRGGRLFSGKVVDVARRTVTGFARGEARLSGTDEHAGGELVLRFQNEHLIAEVDGVVRASVPDLLCTLDTETGTAVTTEALRYGQRLTVIVAPADPRWHTPGGIELAGPRYFGYDMDPVRFGEEP